MMTATDYTFEVQEIEMPRERGRIDFSYIGLAMDVVLLYLGGNFRCEYHLGNNGSQSLSDANSCNIMYPNRRSNLSLIRTESAGRYKFIVNGFPQDRDFEDFRKEIPSLLHRILIEGEIIKKLNNLPSPQKPTNL